MAAFNSKAQINLVPNPSFELINSCDSLYPLIIIDTSTTNYNSCLSWFRTSGGTPDYFNQECLQVFYKMPNGARGYQSPRTGKSMIGIATVPLDSRLQKNLIDLKEYISTKLSSPLIANQYYKVSFYTNLNNKRLTQGGMMNTFATSTVAAYISTNKIQYTDTTGSLNWLQPQITRPKGAYVLDTIGWVEIKGLYQAQGGEQWLTIGDFGITRDDTLLYPNIGSSGEFLSSVNLTYYYIDDVSVTLLNTENSILDTTICKGKQVSFTKRANWDSCQWYDGTKDSLKTFAAAGVYWVTNYYQGLQVIDTFKINTIDTAQSIITQTGFCEGNSAILQARASSTYLWNTGSTNPQIETTTAGLYTVLLSNQECLVTDTFYVTQYSLPIITSLNDTVVCFDQVAQILLDAGQFSSYLWKPTGETTRTIYSNTAQVYLLTVTDSNNCSITKPIAVMETCPEFVFIPNAFTPNSDGVNDVFKVATRSLNDFELSIYNRWGQLLFTTTDATKGWDGSNALADVYVVVVNYKAPNKPLQTVKGTVTLVR